MVHYIGHAFQTCHVITSNKCVQLLTKQLQNCFCLMRQNRRCLSNIHLKYSVGIGSTVIKLKWKPLKHQLSTPSFNN